MGKKCGLKVGYILNTTVPVLISFVPIVYTLRAMLRATTISDTDFLCVQLSDRLFARVEIKQ